MPNSRKLSIYAAEVSTAEKPGATEAYHSFLLIADETDGEFQVLDTLHYLVSDSSQALVNGMPTMMAVTRPYAATPEKLNLYGYIGGDEDYVRGLWDEAIAFGIEVNEQRIPFSQGANKHAFNCRAGTKATIQKLGLDFEPIILDHEDVLNGIEANLLEVVERAHANDASDLIPADSTSPELGLSQSM
jgi:hypothetical protein